MKMWGAALGAYIEPPQTPTWNHLRVVIRKNWNDTEKISMVPAQG